MIIYHKIHLTVNEVPMPIETLNTPTNILFLGFLLGVIFTIIMFTFIEMRSTAKFILSILNKKSSVPCFKSDYITDLQEKIDTLRRHIETFELSLHLEDKRHDDIEESRANLTQLSITLTKAPDKLLAIQDKLSIATKNIQALNIYDHLYSLYKHIKSFTNTLNRIENALNKEQLNFEDYSKKSAYTNVVHIHQRKAG